MAGIATVTMLPSRIVISAPAHSTTRDAPREYVRDGATRAGDSIDVDMLAPTTLGARLVTEYIVGDHG
ncbi:hypothetical protein GCM10010121_052000 [Streptomyces brasiliensis]|uniref:Uncharacterized protein n=1 Tax=Streptomyces brasiliensis TaxID=1954 RepID=A0A917L080_9ACTN|nr:hypothetical protein GCM10010121_052000 [Streptomyces brasiliensis]